MELCRNYGCDYGCVHLVHGTDNFLEVCVLGIAHYQNRLIELAGQDSGGKQTPQTTRLRQ